MSKTENHISHSQPARPAPQGDDLIVWSERHEEPDWDAFLDALLSYALRTVGADQEEDRD